MASTGAKMISVVEGPTARITSSAYDKSISPFPGLINRLHVHPSKPICTTLLSLPINYLTSALLPLLCVDVRFYVFYFILMLLFCLHVCLLNALCTALWSVQTVMNVHLYGSKITFFNNLTSMWHPSYLKIHVIHIILYFMDVKRLVTILITLNHTN